MNAMTLPSPIKTIGTLPEEETGRGVAAALERHPHDIGVVLSLEILDEQSVRESGRGIAQRAPLLLRERCEFVETFCSERGIDGERLRDEEEIGDGYECGRVVADVLEHELIVGERFAGQQTDRVSVRRGVCAGSRRDVERAARLVLNDQGLL